MSKPYDEAKRNEAQLLYETDPTNLRSLAEQLEISPSTLSTWAREYGWTRYYVSEAAAEHRKVVAATSRHKALEGRGNRLVLGQALAARCFQKIFDAVALIQPADLAKDPDLIRAVAGAGKIALDDVRVLDRDVSEAAGLAAVGVGDASGFDEAYRLFLEQNPTLVDN